ncbi:ATPase AAA domain-containing protein 2B [Haplosporangium sp. Z 767]|nr:ATPase AAA domain-containing protein 2B [Haplosporangium sp. Z 11]KAF9188743.1 ATPase AAA domain-containing protein 2B [Haplosporangium sp. Z 767]
MAPEDTTVLDRNHLDTDINETKRRKIHIDDVTSAIDTTSNGTERDDLNHSSQLDGTDKQAFVISDRQRRSTTSSDPTSIEAIRTQRRSLESGPGVKTLDLRRPLKRVNYADPEDSEDDIDRDETPSRPIRAATRSRRRQRSLTPPHILSDGEEGEFSDKNNGVKQEPTPATFGTRTLRDRRSITAPKPFPIGNPTPTTPRLRRSNSGQNSGRSYEESTSMYRPNNRSMAQKGAPPPPTRPITENMRITRGMRSSLLPDSSNSRDVTPDQSTRRNRRTNSRIHHGMSSDEEDQELDNHEGHHEDDDEEMEGGNDDDEQTPNITNQADNSFIRLTRLRARVQAQPTPNSRHTQGRLSRSNAAHSRTRQDVDRKYDLRERPKNRPAYIADRPIPSPPRPRPPRINAFGGRDPYSRSSRSSRPSAFEAYARVGGSSSDEHDMPSFKRRAGTSDSRASTSRILPMNMHELADSRRDVIAARTGLPADTDPLAVGNNVDFDKVGGLDHHIKSLKEMVILPLLYPEVYSHFQMMPPRGVLFHGPPGTGKTLLARALASSCSTETQKVAFFMRKGADCLSKWVGEAERQLRLLFEEAKAWQPSIIFFDEIDGLCPVRSSKQEQIHSSIVSTMLALMDGLDGRGQVIVIGATNRIDAIDPALRRPGRFDREFYFPLPNEAARRAIIDINTCGWVPALDEKFKDELARITTRYCGADIKALCTEAALKAIRRRYPQIYESNEKLQIDASTIVVEEIDMLKSAKSLTPASYRVTGATASPLPPSITPLLEDQCNRICQTVDTIFSGTTKRSSKGTMDDEDASFQAMGYRSFDKLKTFRPRMIIAGQRGMGQRYIGPALLHHLEGCTVQQFDLAALMSESSRTPEAACVQFFIEVKRHAPSVIYIPHIDVWWKVVSEVVKATFSNLLEDLSPEDGILFLATSETPLSGLPMPVKRWFLSSPKGRIELYKPERKDREAFFGPLLVDLARPPTDFKVQAKAPVQLEPLKKAPPPQPRVPTAEEKRLLKEHDQYVLRELRISLRSIVDELFKDRKFKPFLRPVEPEEYPDYYEIIKKPMDLTAISDKINDRMYLDVKEFLADIDLIVENASLYYGLHDPNRITYRARAFQDVVHSMIGRLDPELIIETEKTAARCRKAHQKTQGERMSRRRLGLEAPAVPDDPEMYLRNRAALSKLGFDSAREDSIDPSVKMEVNESVESLGQDPQGQLQQQEQEAVSADAVIAAAPDVVDDGLLNSETSLSLSTASSISCVSLTASAPNGAFDSAPGSLNGIMEVDSPKHREDASMPNSTNDTHSLAMPLMSASLANVSPISTIAADETSAQELVTEFAGLLDEGQPNGSMEHTATDDMDQIEDHKELILNQEDVLQFRSALFKDTECSTVEELDQLRASLYSNIWEHRHDWNKIELLSDMRQTLAIMTSLHQESHEYSLLGSGEEYA